MHVKGKAGIIIEKAGIYEINFQVSALQPNKFTLFADGVAIPSTTFSSSLDNPQTTGLTILSLASNSELTLRNHTSTSTYVDLLSDWYSDETIINAAIIIKRIS
ncbi:MAG TPA: hypothetical protein VI387_06895 [Candidatus Brocadiales bacterium]|nr:hypothetical protein [Candidatus Brocadiales bacterium]